MILIKKDDLRGPEIATLLQAHLAHAARHSPPESIHALDLDRLRCLADKSIAFRKTLIRHEQLILVQAQQSAACNVSHALEARLARWLLRCRDLMTSDNLVLTQEFVGQMLGVRRTSVTLVASTLQQAGLIKYRRGHIHIVNVEGVRSGACECYDKVRANYERLVVS